MTKKQLLNKKNIFLTFCAIAIFVVYGAYEFGFLKSKTPEEVNTNANSSGSVAVIDSNIIVSKPASASVIASPVEISGQVKTNSVFNLQVIDGLSRVIASSTLKIVGDSSDWTTYSQTMFFNPPVTAQGLLRIIPVDGSNVISIPVSFSDYQPTPLVNVFFSNIKKDPEVLNCDVVYPLQRRLLSPEATVGNVMQVLFLGLSDEEVAAGYVNNLPETDVNLLDFSVSDGVATVNFDEGLERGIAGSCRVTAIRAQITETLKQFENIDEVIIAVNGRVDDALQP